MRDIPIVTGYLMAYLHCCSSKLRCSSLWDQSLLSPVLNWASTDSQTANAHALSHNASLHCLDLMSIAPLFYLCQDTTLPRTFDAFC